MVMHRLLALTAACAALSINSPLVYAERCNAKTSTPTTATTTTSPAVTTATPVASSAATDDSSSATAASSTAASTASSTAADYDDDDDTADSEASWAYSTAASASTATTAASSGSTETASSTSSASSATTTSASTSSSGSGSHGTFGTVTSGSDTCVIGDPSDGYISTEDVDWIYANRMTDVPGTNCWIFDQIQLNKGSLDYCVRWDSNDTLALTTASKFADALKRQYKAWNYWLVGYDCWQFDEIDINIVGIAVTDASLLDWTDDSLGTIYVGELDSDGIPQCPDTCYKHLGGAYDADTSSCTGTPFDLSLWPTTRLGDVGGYGSWWGQEVVASSLIDNLDEDEIQILSHEIGHGFGLPDFYDDTDFPDSDPSDFPKCIMQAGASTTVTEGDGWMLRRAWQNISSRYID